MSEINITPLLDQSRADAALLEKYGADNLAYAVRKCGDTYFAPLEGYPPESRQYFPSKLL